MAVECEQNEHAPIGNKGNRRGILAGGAMTGNPEKREKCTAYCGRLDRLSIFLIYVSYPIPSIRIQITMPPNVQFDQQYIN